MTVQFNAGDNISVVRALQKGVNPYDFKLTSKSTMLDWTTQVLDQTPHLAWLTFQWDSSGLTYGEYTYTLTDASGNVARTGIAIMFPEQPAQGIEAYEPINKPVTYGE